MKCKKYLTSNEFDNYEFEGVQHVLQYLLQNSESSLIESAATVFCMCEYRNLVDEPVDQRPSWSFLQTME